jgi:L-iditol 2-dehydrogenase
MRTHVVTAVEKGRVVLRETTVGDPGPGEVQISVHVTLVSPGTERATILEMENTGRSFPVDIGYSAMGTVLKTGGDVTRFKEGDRIACFCLPHCGVGNVSEDFCMPVDPRITDDQAVFLALGVICLQGVRKARIELGEAVMILGMGPIGQLALQLARANGGLPVIGADRVESRLKMAAAMGADAVLDMEQGDWQARLKAITGDEGPQVVIESTGFPDPINSAFEAVRKFGRVALLGSTRGVATVNFYATIHKKALTVVGAHIMGNPSHESQPGFWTWKDDAAAFLRLVMQGRISVEPLITEKIEWRKVEHVYEKLLRWDTGMMIPAVYWK